MSLLIDVLRKFRDNNRKISVHPLIAKGKGSQEPLKKKAVLVLAPLVLISGLGAYFLTQLVVGGFEPAPVDIRYREQLRAKLPQEPLPEKESVEETLIPVSENNLPSEPEPVQSPTEIKVRQPVRSNVKEEPVEKLVEELKEVKKVSSSVIDINSLLYKADKSFREGDLRKSAELYEKVLSIKPTDSAVNNLLVVYARLGEFIKAERLLGEFPKEKFIYSYLIELSKNGHYERALKLSDKFLYLDKNGYLHFARGYIYEQLGDIGSALAEYRRAYQKSSSVPYFTYNYARLLEFTGRYREAYKLYESLNSTELEPNLKGIVEQRLRYLRLMGF